MSTINRLPRVSCDGPTIFVVGVQQNGGCWLWTDNYFPSQEDAYKFVENEISAGLNMYAVFHLYPVKLQEAV